MPLIDTTGIRPIERRQPTDDVSRARRREEGTSSAFRPQTDVALKTAIQDLAATLGKISSEEKYGIQKLPKEIGDVVKNILRQSLSMDATLGKGIGSTVESQRFSMDQIMLFSRLLSQMGVLAEKNYSMRIGEETQLLLSNLKDIVIAEAGGEELEPVLMTKSSFELVDAKVAEQLPQALYEMLSQLANMPVANQQQTPSEGMQFLKQLVRYFIPRPEVDDFAQEQEINSPQPELQNQSEQQTRSPSQSAQKFLDSVFRNFGGKFAEQPQQPQPQNQQAQFNQSQPQNQQAQFNQSQPQNQQTQFNQNLPQNQTQFNQNLPQNQQPQFNQNQPQNQQAQFNQNLPQNQQTQFNQNQPQNQQAQFNQNLPQNQQAQFNQNLPQNQQVPFNQNLPQNQQAQFNQNQPQNQQVPFNQNLPQNQQAQFNQNLPQNQQVPFNQNQPQNQQAQFNQNLPQNQQAQFNQSLPQNQQAQFNQNLPQNQQAQFNQSQPQNQQTQFNQSQPQNQQAQFNQNLPQSQQLQFNQSQPQNQQAQFNQNLPQSQQLQFNQSQPQNQTQFNQNQPQNQQAQFNQNLPQEEIPLPTFPLNRKFVVRQRTMRRQMDSDKKELTKTNLLNTPQTFNTMKNLAQFIIQNKDTNPRETALFKNFINNSQEMMSETEARHLQNLLRLCQQNIPFTVRQAAVQQNLPDLPRLWAFMQMCDMARLNLKMTPKALKKAGKDVAAFATALRGSMSSDNAVVQNQRSFQMMIPLYMSDNETSYPTYFNIYDETNRDEDTGEDKKETWVRMCILTDHVGAVELVFRIYDETKLDMRFYFSQREIAKEFGDIYIDRLKNSMKDFSLRVGEITVGSVGEGIYNYT